MIGPRRPGRPRKLPGSKPSPAPALLGELDDDLAGEGVVAEPLDAPRAMDIAEIADRDERARQLSQLLRDLSASGAERVAAARLLESMDRSASAGEGDQAGPPPPSTRAEQVVRLVKVLACAGADVRIEALTIIANRSGEQRARILEMARQVSVPLTQPTTTVANSPTIPAARPPEPTTLPLPELQPLEEFHERTKVGG